MKYFANSLGAMGYRRLLKNYLQHVDHLLGSTLLETVSESELFSKRDIGELGSIVAELARESANRVSAPDVDQGALLAAIIRGYGLAVEDAAELSKIPTAKLNQWCYSEPNCGVTPPTKEEFRQVIFAILASQGRRREGTDARSSGGASD